MFKPFKLTYNFSDLEPFIDSETMRIHYLKHYLTYTNNLNKLLRENGMQSEQILPIIKNATNLPKGIRNNAGGYYNHTLFWQMLKPIYGINDYFSRKNRPYGVSRKIIDRDFGSYENFHQKIKSAAKSRFGSGWVWWIMNPNGKTEIVQTPYQDNPKMYKDCKILLGIDVWEHAYYLKHNADRMKYIDDVMKVINWDYSDKKINE
jgi:Fe-Mn family superoxide dismutase